MPVRGRLIGSDELARAVEFFRRRPDPPRDIRLIDGKLAWTPPANQAGVTHFNIYANDERSFVEQVPVGQTVLRTTLEAARVLVSSWNAPLQLESAKVLFNQAVSGGTGPHLEDLFVTIGSVTKTYQTTADSNGAVLMEVTVTGTGGGTGFDRIALYARRPQPSDPSPLDPEPDGILEPIGEFTGLGSPWTIKFTAPPPGRSEGWKFYFCPGNPDGTVPWSNSAVSWLLLVDPLPAGGSGLEWAPNVTGLSGSVEYGVSETGGQVFRIVGTFTPPIDAKYRGATIVGRDAGSRDRILSFVPPGSSGYASIWMSVPDVSETWTVFARSVGPNTNSNAIVPGTTPSFTVFITRQAGGGLKLNRVDTSTLDASEFQISAGALRLKELDVTKARTGILSVGGGGNKPGQVAVFDGANSFIGWIGQQGSDYGGWFKQLYVGGNAPASSPFRVDSSGNVLIDNTGMSQLATFTLIRNGVTTKLVNNDPGAFGSYYSLDSIGGGLRAAISPFGLDLYTGGALSLYADVAGLHMARIGGGLWEWSRSNGNINAGSYQVSGNNAIDSGRIGYLNGLYVNAAQVIDLARNVLANSVSVNGVTRITTFGDVYGVEVNSDSGFFTAGLKVVGSRQTHINNVTGSLPQGALDTTQWATLLDTISKLNQILTLLANHGLMA